MATITTRSGKGSPLTNTEVDDNFENLNNAKLEASGFSMTGDIVMGDDVELKFGAFTGGDLRIYHDSDAPKSVIAEQGGGPLELRTSQLNMTTEDGSADVMRANASSVKLYGSNAVVLNATSSGVDITGDVDATGDISGSNLVVKQNGATSIVFGEKASGDSTTVQIGKGYDQTSQIIFQGSSDTWSGIYADQSEHLIVSLDQNEALTNPASFHVKGAGQTKSHLEVSELSDVKFFDTAGTTAQVEWTAASQLLNVTGTVQADKYTNDEALPDVAPSLLLDFANVKELDPRIDFDRASTGTYWDGVTRVKAEENFQPYSADLSTAGASRLTLTNNAATAPDGSTTARRSVATTTNGTHYYTQIGAKTLEAGSTYTVSMHVKADGINYVALGAYGYNASRCGAVFNLSNGTVEIENCVALNGASVSSRGIESVGAGWYRIYVTMTMGANHTANAIMTLQDTANSSIIYAFAGDGTTDGILSWGGQLERRDYLTAFVATGSQPVRKYQPKLMTAPVDQPRFNHNPATGESKGLLLESQSTNEFTGVWNASSTSPYGNAPASWSLTLAPDGTNTAHVPLADSSADRYQHTVSSGTLSNGNSLVVSWYSKLISGAPDNASSGYVSISNIGGLALDGSVEEIEDCGNGWKRFQQAFTVSDSSQHGYVRLYFGGIVQWADQSVASLNGDRVAYWGIQVEYNKAFASSYIPTSGSTVTRSVDRASIEDITPFYNEHESTILVQHTDAHYRQNARLWAFDDDSTSNYYGLQTSTTSSYRFAVITPGTTQVSSSPAVTNGWSETHRFAVSIQTNDIRIQGPGVAYNDGVNELPVVNRLQIGGLDRGFPFDGHIMKFVYYPKRFSDETLEAMVEV